jgi:hypothetical protein
MAKLTLQVLSVMQILFFLPPAPGERFFQLRDHSDQNKYLREQHMTIIHNRKEAEVRAAMSCKFIAKIVIVYFYLPFLHFQFYIQHRENIPTKRLQVLEKEN